MELKRDAVLFVNLIYRILLLIGFLNEDEAPNFPVKDPILNWNYVITDRVVLILANGLRHDFLEEDATPFLSRVANGLGTFARAEVRGFVSLESGVKLILTGVPGHSCLFPWNRPQKYRTILDFIACKCVIGQLPLEKTPICFHPCSSQVEAFGKLRMLINAEENKVCLYVSSFDFSSFAEGEYKQRLAGLDDDVRSVVEEIEEKWKDTRTTFVLTSGRGWSIWNRTDGNVDIPVMIWGYGVIPREPKGNLRVSDVPAMISALLGRSFPAACEGKIPTFFFNITTDAKFHMLLYNSEHLEKTMSDDVNEDDEFEVRRLKGFVEEEDVMTLQLSVDKFLENVDAVRLNRMKLVSAMTIFSFLLWGFIFIVVAFRGSLTLDLSPWTCVCISVVALVTVGFTTQAVVQDVLLEVLVPVAMHMYNDVITAFRREGFRAFFVAALSSILLSVFSIFGNLPSIIAVTTIILLWPIFWGLVRRTNKKILALWLMSGVTFMFLSHSPVIGRTPSPALIALGTALEILLFQVVFILFKRVIDFQSWILITAAAAAGCHAFFFGSTQVAAVGALLSWGFLSFFTVATCVVNGTLLERLVKFHLVLIVPLQILSVRHECIFHVALTAQMFCWIFIENVPDDKFVLLYNPSMFSLEKPEEYASDKLYAKNYRQILLFLSYCYVAFFAAGNSPNLYSYDFNVLKPFGNLFGYFLIPLKFLLPYMSVTFSFLTLNYTQKRDPALLFILSLYFSDVYASCLLSYTYFMGDIFSFNPSHYIILQIVTTSVTALYFVEKYLCLN